jgi:hypothetical protein
MHDFAAPQFFDRSILFPSKLARLEVVFVPEAICEALAVVADAPANRATATAAKMAISCKGNP